MEEAARIEAQLAIARQSDRDEVASLADAIDDYLQKEKRHLSAEPGRWRRTTTSVETLARPGSPRGTCRAEKRPETGL